MSLLRLRCLLEDAYEELVGEQKKEFASKKDFVNDLINRKWFGDKRKHPTHVRVYIGKELRYGRNIEEEGVVSREFLEYLKEKDPLLDFGEICGKHSEVQFKWSELNTDWDDDYYDIVSSANDKGDEMFFGVPDCLDHVYDTWPEETRMKKQKTEEKEDITKQ